MNVVDPTTVDLLGQLLRAVRGLVPCDAAAVLRRLPEPVADAEGAVLQPVAVDGLVEEALGRRFAAAAHPRLARLLASGPAGLRFAADGGLPDPYDGLLAHQQELKAVHDCMGLPLMHEGRVWGLLTLDALDPHAFDGVDAARLQSLAQIFQAAIGAQTALQTLGAHAAQAQAIAQVMAQAHGPSGRARELLGKSAAMQQLRHEIDTVAASDLTVLILGETGVGKELVAERLHARSARQSRPLVQINCAALPETLADSELFGHKRGAFTGAIADRVGKFELADGGTLFLDEVGELALSVQAKLLRVLQSGEVQRPGSDQTRRVDVRVIAATNRDLGQEVAQGRFRADLYHRLSVYPLHVPALRERGRDVLTLAGSFLEENQRRLGARNLRLTPQASAALLGQPWPGNVRELEHLISRAALRAWSEAGRGGRWTAVEARHLGLESSAAPSVVSAAGGAESAAGGAADAGATAAPRRLAPEAMPALPSLDAPGLRAATEAFQRQWIEGALQRQGGSLAGVAREAGMDRSNLLRLARRLGLRDAPAAPTPAPRPRRPRAGSSIVDR